MLTMMSVKEILQFNAGVRLPDSTTPEQRRSIVNSVINVLGLYGRCLKEENERYIVLLYPFILHLSYP